MQWNYQINAKTYEKLNRIFLFYLFVVAWILDTQEVKNTTTIIRLEKDADEQQFTSVKTRSDPCLQPKVEGPCEAYIPSYFYNKDSEDCEPFIYGGCHGNDNNFKNLNECRSQCVASVKSDPPTPPPAEPFNSNVS